MGRTALRTFATATAALALIGVASCTTDGPDDGRVDVVAAAYPLQFVAERVGGDAVRVTALAKPGAEPHDVELNPGQVGQISKADLIVYLSGFQPAVDEAVAQEGGDRGFDVAEVVPLLDAAAGAHRHDEADEHRHDSGKDPHVWLDPVRLATVGDRLAERLAETDPDRADGYRARAAALRDELETLDREYRDGLGTCRRREIVVSHAAFGYLADRYGLEQIAVSGLTPDDDPAPQQLAEVVEEAKAHGATTIFFETLASPKVAETIAREVGAQTAVLDPIEGPTPGADYLALMRTNLAALKSALGCS
ncbi:MAG TPA: metal ABC transporter substrate-binding protein [Micromonosporaceae bacterium]